MVAYKVENEGVALESLLRQIVQLGTGSLMPTPDILYHVECRIINRSVHVNVNPNKSDLLMEISGVLDSWTSMPHQIFIQMNSDESLTICYYNIQRSIFQNFKRLSTYRVCSCFQLKHSHSRIERN